MTGGQFRLGVRCIRMCENNVMVNFRHHSYRGLACFYLSTTDSLNHMRNRQICTGSYISSKRQHKFLISDLSKRCVHSMRPFQTMPALLTCEEKLAYPMKSRHFHNLSSSVCNQPNDYKFEEFQRSVDETSRYLNQTDFDSLTCKHLVETMKDTFLAEVFSDRPWLLQRLDLPLSFQGITGIVPYVQSATVPSKIAEQFGDIAHVLSIRTSELEPNDAVSIAYDLYLLGCTSDSPEITKLLEKALQPDNDLSLESASKGIVMCPEAIPDGLISEFLLQCSKSPYKFDTDSGMLQYFSVLSHAFYTNQEIDSSTLDILEKICENEMVSENIDVCVRLFHLVGVMRCNAWFARQSQETTDWLTDLSCELANKIVHSQSKPMSLSQIIHITNSLKYWKSYGYFDVSQIDMNDALDNMMSARLSESMSTDDIILMYRYKTKHFLQDQQKWENMLIKNWDEIDAWSLEKILEIPSMIENQDLLALIQHQLLRSDSLTHRQCVLVLTFLSTSVKPAARALKMKAFNSLLQSFQTEEKLRMKPFGWENLLSVVPNERIPEVILDQVYQALDSYDPFSLTQSVTVVSSVRGLYSTNLSDLTLSQQLSALSMYYEDKLFRMIDDIHDIHWLCMCIRRLYLQVNNIENLHIWDPVKRNKIFNRIRELYIGLSPKQKESHFQHVCKVFWVTNYHDAALFDQLAVDVTKFDSIQLQCLNKLAKLFGIFGFVPSNLGDLQELVNNFPFSEISMQGIGHQLEFIRHLNKCGIFPEKLMKAIFTVGFMNKVNAVSDDIRYLYIKHLAIVNQYAVIDCPHFNIPWLDLWNRYLKEEVSTRRDIGCDVPMNNPSNKVYVIFGRKVEQDGISKFADFLTDKMKNNGFTKKKARPLTTIHLNSVILEFSSKELAQIALKFHRSYYMGSPVDIFRTTGIVPNNRNIKKEVHAALLELAGQECVVSNHSLKYGYTCDFMVCLSPDRKFVPVADLNDKPLSQEGFKKFAVNVRPEISYPVNVKIPKNNRIISHVNKLGYNSIAIYHDVWHSMALSSMTDRVNYLKKKILSSFENGP